MKNKYISKVEGAAMLKGYLLPWLQRERGRERARDLLFVWFFVTEQFLGKKWSRGEKKERSSVIYPSTICHLYSVVPVSGSREPAGAFPALCQRKLNTNAKQRYLDKLLEIANVNGSTVLKQNQPNSTATSQTTTFRDGCDASLSFSYNVSLI